MVKKSKIYLNFNINIKIYFLKKNFIRYKNNERLNEDHTHISDEKKHSKHNFKHNNSNLVIEKKILNDNMFTSLYIRQSSLNDAGVYMCKFGHLHDKIYVDVIVNDISLKYRSSEIRSNDDSAYQDTANSKSVAAASSHLKILNSPYSIVFNF